jgi:hypothetical protein
MFVNWKITIVMLGIGMEPSEKLERGQTSANLD